MEKVGEFLRRAREARSLSLEQVSQQTRIPVRILRDLEDGSKAGLPGSVYVRGFVKAYCKAVGAAHEPVMDLFEESGRCGTAGREHADLALLAGRNEAPPRGLRVAHLVLVVVAVLTFVVAYLASGVGRSDEETAAAGKAPAVQHAMDAFSSITSHAR